MHSVIDILPLFLVLISLIGIRCFPESSGWNTEYLSRKTSASVKGILCVVVLFHHLAYCTSDGILFPIFSHIGFLAVSMFFFYSGYGLQKRNLTDPNYYIHFGLNRIPCVLFPYIIVTLLYWFLSIFSSPYSALDVWNGLFNGEPIVRHSWYVITILIFYCVFDLLLHLFHGNNRALLLGVGGFCILWLSTCVALGRGGYWYNTPHLLLFGVCWATYEKDILNALHGKIWRWLLADAVLLCAVILMWKLDLLYPHFLVSVLFVFFILLLLMKFNISNRILNFLGSISYEVYLTQGIFIPLFRSQHLMVRNDTIYCTLVLLSTVAASFGLHLLFKRILSKYKTFLKQYHAVGSK